MIIWKRIDISDHQIKHYLLSPKTIAICNRKTVSLNTLKTTYCQCISLLYQVSDIFLYGIAFMSIISKRQSYNNDGLLVFNVAIHYTQGGFIDVSGRKGTWFKKLSILWYNELKWRNDTDFFFVYISSNSYKQFKQTLDYLNTNCHQLWWYRTYFCGTK